VNFLVSEQAEDGGFHSRTYGLLRSGQSLTPFVLNALLAAPDLAKPAVADRAFRFIQKNMRADGSLGLMDETAADYPNYATALALTATVRAGRSEAKRNIALMMGYLRSQQFQEANGWNHDDAPYGAWGMGGAIRRPPNTGHVDLSMTRFVLEALRAAGVPKDDPIVARALVYLKRSQNLDGGFFFSTVNPEINKGGEAGGGFASYGTATADGLLALRAAGVPDGDMRVARAVQWLKEHHRPDRAPGFDGTARESWGSGLRFYYAYVISRAIPGLPLSLPPQAADGSYQNPNKMVKEDDPLIATTFAVHVLNSQD
jgi:squalene-hopene/tetraprenyl-beta-curcumene cyclase